MDKYKKLEAQNKRLREKNKTLKMAVKLMIREFDTHEMIIEQDTKIKKFNIEIQEITDSLNAAIKNITELEHKNGDLNDLLNKIKGELLALDRK